MLTENFFDFLPHRLREEKCGMLNQSINQSIKWSLLLLLFSCHDYNNDKDDIPATIIYNMRKSLLKIILHDKLSSSYCICLFMRLCMCM
jgi:hypothetical protein